MLQNALAQANSAPRMKPPRWFRRIRIGVNRFWNIRFPGTKNPKPFKSRISLP